MIALAGAGVYLLGWVRDEHLPLLSNLVIKVALPCMIVNNVLGQYTPESLAENLPALAAALLSVLLTLLLALPIGKALNTAGSRLGVFVVMFAFSEQRVHRRAGVAGAVRRGGAALHAALLSCQHLAFLGRGFPLMRKYGGAASAGGASRPCRWWSSSSAFCWSCCALSRRSSSWTPAVIWAIW